MRNSKKYSYKIHWPPTKNSKRYCNGIFIKDPLVLPSIWFLSKPPGTMAHLNHGQMKSISCSLTKTLCQLRTTIRSEHVEMKAHLL